MEEMILNEKGEVIDFFEEQNKTILQKMESFIDVLKTEKIVNDARSKPQNIKFGSRFYVKLMSVLSEFDLISEQEFDEFDKETLRRGFESFMELIAVFNTDFEVPINKQLLYAYLRINSRMYEKLENHEDREIKNIVQSFNDRLIGIGFASSEAGNTDSKSVMSRMKIRRDGMGLVENDLAATMIISNDDKKVTDREVMKQLQNLGIFQIEQKNR